ncbi:MAG: FMN-binding protein [Deltaproteobacteria bacterium]|nr:FMN-binding protein [Deltaproteobacteria bacterium]
MILKITIPISILLVLLVPSPSFSKVYMTKGEALKLAFPGGDRVEKKTVFLTEEQAKKIESIAKTKLESKLYVFYVGKKENETLGYAVIDTHLLRTVTETIMVVINPDGILRQAEILAFFEPPDYMPGDSWMNLFHSKTLDDSLRIGRGVPNITGATITSNAMVEAIRRVMAVFDVAVKGNQKLAVEGKK